MSSAVDILKIYLKSSWAITDDISSMSQCSTGFVFSFCSYYLQNIVITVNIDINLKIYKNYSYIIDIKCQLYYAKLSIFKKKQGTLGPQKPSSLKSLHNPPLSKTTGMCHETVRNGFLIKF